MTTSTQSPLNLVRGPAKKPEWAQLIRLGGDRVAILFKELRDAVGKVEGIVERLHYSAGEARWTVQYYAGGTELFSVRISAGFLEASMPLSHSEMETLLTRRNVSARIRDAIRSGAGQTGLSLLRLPLMDRRLVRSFASLANAKSKLVSTARMRAG